MAFRCNLVRVPSIKLWLISTKTMHSRIMIIHFTKFLFRNRKFSGNFELDNWDGLIEIFKIFLSIIRCSHYFKCIENYWDSLWDLIKTESHFFRFILNFVGSTCEEISSYWEYQEKMFPQVTGNQQIQLMNMIISHSMITN